MCHMATSDKQWLRERLGNPGAGQVERFLEGVGKRLDHIRQPTAEQLHDARSESFRALTGLVE